MSTVDPEFSRVNYGERDKEFSVLSKDDSHVRVMKLFPMCKAKNPPLEDYRRFHLRFYIPRDIFDDKCKKVSKLFIMLNGLDEIDYFTLYDQLGQGLARYGYASVLLPLPDHLNRNKRYRFSDPKIAEKPSDLFIKEREKIYTGYLQSMEEITFLTDHLKHKCKNTQKESPCDFYKHLFDEDLTISVLGYSMGGLGALSAMLLHRDLFNTCIMLNSGAKLEDIDVSDFIPINKWKQMVSGIQNDWEYKLNKSEKAKIFNRIFLGNSPSSFKKELREISRKVCFILGGSDSVTKYKSIQDIEPDEYGLAILKMPGINHFLSLDMQWNRWFKLVINMIAQFDDSATKEVLTHNEIINEFIQYQAKYGVFECARVCCPDRIDDPIEKFNFHRVLYAAEGSFSNLPTAVIEMYLTLERMAKRPLLYPSFEMYPYDGLFGRKAIAAHGISSVTILEMLREQRKCAIKGENIPKIGELLVKAGHISEKERDKLL